MKVGIIGCGLIGRKRAHALGAATLIAVADLDLTRAQRLAAEFSNCQAHNDYKEVLKSDCDIIIIATTHQMLAELAIAAANAKKHVLIEKPAARNTHELQTIIDAAKKNKVWVHVGFNHRYHRALQKAKQLVQAGELGELMFVRARYGHGGRLGYDQEWRADPSLSGGGELIDQGVHIIDLARWFLGDFNSIDGFAHTYYWNMPVEDNGFMLLKTSANQVAFLHASCTEWKNTFSFEIYGKKSKIAIEGLGGSYGTERLTLYQMLPEMGPPPTTTWEYPMADNSWAAEFAEFMQDVQNNQPSPCNLQDAYAALEIVEAIYRKSGYDYHS